RHRTLSNYAEESQFKSTRPVAASTPAHDKSVLSIIHRFQRRVRETAIGFGDQRIYASHHSIMFSRNSCYFFVRPKKSFIELCVFLGRDLVRQLFGLLHGRTATSILFLSALKWACW